MIWKMRLLANFSIATVLSAGVVLTPADARHWSTALNDVRLVLAERLDIRDDADAEHVHRMQDWSQAEDVESYLALVYNFTTWLQESLVQAMLASLEA